MKLLINLWLDQAAKLPYTAEIFGKIDMERFGPYLSVDYYQLPES